MTAEFLGNHLDKMGHEVTAMYMNSVGKSPVLSLLFDSYARLLDNKGATSKFYWEKLFDSHVVWTQTKNKKILSAIVYELHKETNTGILLTAFTDPDYNGRGLNRICLKHYLDKLKKDGVARTLGIVSLQNFDALNTEDPKKISFTGVAPTDVVLTCRV